MDSNKSYSWEDNFKSTLTLLKYMGLWPSSADGYKLELYTLYTSLMGFVCVLCHISSQIVLIFFVRDNLNAVAAIVYMVLIELVGVCKIYSILKKMKLLKLVIAKLQNYQFQPQSLNQKLIIEPSVKLWKKFFSTYLGMLLICNTIWIIYPLVDGSTERRLIFMAWFPFDYKISPYYEIVYFVQAISTMYLTLLHTNVDALLSGFNVTVGCQFELLADNIRNLGREMIAEEMHENLVKCVLHHREILNFVKAVAPFSDWILFWHVILTGVYIGVTMFQLTIVVPYSNEFYSYISFSVAATLQIFIHCWFANEVKVKGNLLSYAAFESNWIDKPEKFKKDLIFFVLKTMKPINISALNVFEISVQTFMKILKTAWSYFALLTTLSTKE